MVTNNRTYTNTKTCPKCKQTRVYFLVYDHRIYVPAHRPHSSGSGSSSSRHFTLNIRLTRHFKYATASRRTSSTVYRQLLIGFVYVSTTVSCRRPVVPFTRTHRNAECSRWTANYGNSKSNANTNNGRKKKSWLPLHRSPNATYMQFKFIDSTSIFVCWIYRPHVRKVDVEFIWKFIEVDWEERFVN